MEILGGRAIKQMKMEAKAIVVAYVHIRCLNKDLILVKIQIKRRATILDLTNSNNPNY